MSWSEYFNSKQSPLVKDSYHRIALTTTITEFNNETTLSTLARYVTVNFLHLAVVLHDKVTSADIKSMLANMNTLKTLVSHTGIKASEHLIFTIRLNYIPLSREMVEGLASHDIACMVIINYQTGRVQFVENFSNFTKSMESIESRIYFGIGKIEDQNELDWILSRIPRNSIEVVNVGTVSIPNVDGCINLSLRKTDIIHKYGYNTMISIGSVEFQDITESEYLRKMSLKYEGTTSATMLVKALLQLGNIVCIDVGTLDESFCRTNFERLIHPFVYRRSFVSAVRIISLEIAIEDVEDLSTTSEQGESKEDQLWKPFAIESIAVRKLTHGVDIAHM